METVAFRTLLRDARAGNAQAAAVLVEEFSPALRRQIRMHLTDPWLRRVIDTSDLLPSVLGNFFIRLAAGQFDLERPEQLIKLLSVMAVNRIRNHARSAKAEGGAKRTEKGSSLSGIAMHGVSPSEIVANKELLERVYDLLAEDERALAERRTAGLTWDQIAEELGGSAEALRKKFVRAMDRIARQFDFE